MRALAQLGEPRNFPALLSTLKRKKATSFHTQLLADLGRVSDPAGYQKLETTVLEHFTARPVTEYLVQLSEAVDVPIIVSEEVSRGDTSRIVAGSSRGTALNYLTQSIDVLNYSGYRYTLFLDRGIVKIVTVEEAIHPDNPDPSRSRST